jgi:hypothetical protein
MVKQLGMVRKAKPVAKGTVKDVHKAQCEIGRKNLRRALLLKLAQAAQKQRGNSVGAASKNVTSTMDTVHDKDRAGYPLVLGKLKPKDWKTNRGKRVFVDLNRVSWLPDAWGQGIKMTNEIATSKPGHRGTYTVWVAPEGEVYYHKFAVEAHLRRHGLLAEDKELDHFDGFNGLMRTARLQRKRTDEEKFFQLLTAKERKHLPKADSLHFCVVSARRTRTYEGLQDIAAVTAQFEVAGVKPTWYVDAESLEEYRRLGLNAKVGGKLTAARNLCLVDAQKMGKACVQCSDDISRWEYAAGKRATERTDDAVNAAHAAATIHIITPVAAARFMLAKLRSAETPQRPQLAGIYPLGSCARTFAGDEFGAHNFIIGDFFVVDKSPVRFDPNMTLKEDYGFTCSHMDKHGAVLRCNRMTISVKHYSNSGGACSIRDSKGLEEKKNLAILMKRWPRAFRMNPKRNNEVILRWPTKNVSDAIEDDFEGSKLAKTLSTSSSRSSGGSTKLGVKKDVSLKKATKGRLFKPHKIIVRGSATSQSEYIRTRVKAILGKKVGNVIGRIQYENAAGDWKTYSTPDLRYDLHTDVLSLR